MIPKESRNPIKYSLQLLIVAAFYFSLLSAIIPNRPSTSTSDRIPASIHPLSNTNPKFFMATPSLTPRGGGIRQASVKPSEKDNDAKEYKIGEEAFASICSCYRVCYLAVFTELFFTLLDLETLSKMKVTWIEAIDIADSLHLFVFAWGLQRVSRIWPRMKKARQSGEKMSSDRIYELNSIMASLWRNSALVHVGLSLVTASKLKKYVNFFSTSSSMLPGIVGAIAAVTATILLNRFENDRKNIFKQEDDTQVQPGYEKARSMGFITCRNMKLCAGAFSLMASLEFVQWALKPADLITRILTVFDFITPGKIATLLLSLYSGYMRAVVHGTVRRTIGYEEFNDLFEAQKGFYSEVTSTVQFAIFFGVLPPTIAFVKHIMAMLS